MPITNLQIGQTGLVGTLPAISYISTNDTEATITTAGYLNHEVQNGAAFPIPSIALVSTVSSPGAKPDCGWYEVQHNGTNWSLVSPVDSAPAVFAVTSTSATPGTVRALTGKISETATVMTSGNIVGVRGEADVVGASAGFVYGCQGKVIATGTLSGSSWTAGVFAQFDISTATINAGQTAPVWADYGASSGTITSGTGMRMFAGTNTTAATLFAMDYRYGKATNLFELDGSASTYISAGAATPSGDMKKIAISIDGVTHYILAAAVWS